MAKFGYIGNQPDASSVIVARQIYNTTSAVGVVTFTSGYTPGYMDVYLNGVRLVDGLDFSASDGRTIILSNATISGDVIEAVAYKGLSLATVSLGIQSGGQLIRDSVKTLNFIGAGNTFKTFGDTVDISISGGGGAVGVSSNSFSTLVGTGITHFNFVGAAVTVLGDGDVGGAKTAVVNVTSSEKKSDYFIVRRPAVGVATLSVRKTNFTSDISYNDYAFDPTKQDQFFAPSDLTFAINSNGHLTFTFDN